MILCRSNIFRKIRWFKRKDRNGWFFRPIKLPSKIRAPGTLLKNFSLTRILVTSFQNAVWILGRCCIRWSKICMEPVRISLSKRLSLSVKLIVKSKKMPVLRSKGRVISWESPNKKLSKFLSKKNSSTKIAHFYLTKKVEWILPQSPSILPIKTLNN